MDLVSSDSIPTIFEFGKYKSRINASRFYFCAKSIFHGDHRLQISLLSLIRVRLGNWLDTIATAAGFFSQEQQFGCCIPAVCTTLFLD